MSPTASRIARLSILLLAVGMLCGASSAFLIDGATFATGYSHTVNGISGTTLTYYQIPYILSNSTGDPSGNVIYTDGSTQPDWSDIRFTSDSNTIYPHWIESTSSTSATVWVNVTSIPATGTTMRVYYGSTSASQTSNIDKTMEFGDEFNGSSLDAAKWTVVSGQPYTIADGLITVTGAKDAADRIDSTRTFGPGTAAIFLAKQVSYTAGQSGSSYWGYRSDTPEPGSFWNTPGFGYNAGESHYTMALHPDFARWEVIRNGSTSVIFSKNRGDVQVVTSGLSSAAVPISMREYRGGFNPDQMAVDWLAVRKYVANEPTHGGYSAVSGSPISAFSATPLSGANPLDVQFNDTSTGDPTAWNWSFGDGTTSSLQNPTHTYSSTGTFTVNLTATNAYGNDTETKAGYITVGDAPVAAFAGSPVSGKAPLTVAFTDESTGSPTAWAWDFDGDAVADSTDQNPSHEYAADGNYTVTLQVSNIGGTDLETKTNYIYVGPLTARMLRASFSYTKPVGTAPFSVTFTDTSASNGTYVRNWDFGDGDTSTEANPVHEYSSSGKYDVKLIITSDHTSDSSTARKAIMAYPAEAVSPLPTTTFGAHMTEIMESNWNVSVIGPIIPRAYTDVLTPLTGNTGVGDMIFWGIIWVGVFMILFLRQGTPWLAALVGLVAGPGILTFLPPEWAHVGYICLAVTIGCSFFVIALGRFRST